MIQTMASELPREVQPTSGGMPTRVIMMMKVTAAGPPLIVQGLHSL